MVAKYGSIKEDEKIVENAKEAVDGIEVQLRTRKKWCILDKNLLFGFGTVYNDLVSAMWFSYMLLFLQAVLLVKPVVAGSLLLLGQIVDAVSTPIIGMLMDKFSTKKIWHLIGCLVVSLTFPLLYIRCWGCHIDNTPTKRYLQWWIPIYYGSIITIFQIGWATVQIAHLAMITALTDSQQVRSELTSIRYMASVMSSLLAYFITWVVLKTSKYSAFIGPDDDYKFRDIALTISAIGMLSFITFHMVYKFVPEKKSSANGHFVPYKQTTQSFDKDEKTVNGIIAFLKNPLLYQISLLYVFSRLYWAISLVYVPLFLEERLTVNPGEGSSMVASVPFVIYVSSLVLSIIFKNKLSSCGKQVMYFIGSLISLTGCIWIALALNPYAGAPQVFAVAAFIGAGSAITLVASLCMTADMIGPNTAQGATVYAIVTFADKLIAGIVIVVIEDFKCENSEDCPQYYRGVLAFAGGGSVILGILTQVFTKLVNRNKHIS